MYTDAAVFTDGRFGGGAHSGFLQFSWCSSGYSHVKHCGFNVRSCSDVCRDNYHEIGLRCYGKSINNNKINTVYTLLYNTSYNGN